MTRSDLPPVAVRDRLASPFGESIPARWPRLRLPVLGAVFAGGALGGLSRYAVTRTWPTPAHGFPWSTLAVNLSGAFLLALLLVVVSDVLRPTTYVRPLLGTGFLGTWTTFSAVAADSDQLIAHGHAVTGAAYVAASVLGGLAAAAFGLVSGRAVSANRHRRAERGRA